MPSILDLVNEYFQLDKQRDDQGGVLDQASEMRHQCLKFFLEFDLAAPYVAAHDAIVAPHSPEADVAPIAGAHEQHHLGVHDAEDRPPGAEITGFGTAPPGVESAAPAPEQDDVPLIARELDNEIMRPPLPGEPPTPVCEPPPPVPEPTASGGPLDIHDADLSATVDDFFSTHVDADGAAVAVAAPEVATLDMASAQTAFPAPMAEPAAQEPVPQEIGTDDIESLPLDDAVALDTPLTPHEVIHEPTPEHAAAAMEPLPEFPLTFDEPAVPVEAPAIRAEPAPLAASWEMAVPPEQSVAKSLPTVTVDPGPSFDLPLTFDAPAPVPAAMSSATILVAAPFEPMPIEAPAPEPIPAAVSFDPAPIFAPEPAPTPETPAALAFAIAESHRVTVHFLDGDVKRGVVREFGYDANDLCLFTMDEQGSDYYPIAALKAVFLILQPGAKVPEMPAGKDLSVTFKDGRTLKGRSPDFTPVMKIFTLFPDPRQGNIERVVVFKEAIDEVH